MITLTRCAQAVVISGIVVAMTQPIAQTTADLDKATLAANIAEQEKKAAQAKNDAAVAQANAAVAAAKTVNELAKSKAESEKSQADAAKANADADKAVADSVKAGLPTPPDPSKYKVEKPAAPTLAATVARLTFEQSVVLAGKITPKIVAAANNNTIVADDAKVRTLVAMGTATREALLTAKAGLDGQALDITNRIANRPTPAFAMGTAVAIGALLENVLAYATILRTQYGFTTVSATSSAEFALTALVLGGLPSAITFVDVDGALPLNPSAIAGHLSALRASILAGRNVVTNVATWTKSKRGETSIGTTDAEKAASHTANIKAADDVDRMADALGRTIEEAQKLVAALFIVDTQGNTAFDAAQRGEALATTLAVNPKVVTLTLKVVSSDVDTIATDRLFAGLKVFAGNTTVARWKVVDSAGKLIGAGAEMENFGLQRIALTGD